MTKKKLSKIAIWGLALILIALTAPKEVLAEKEPTYEYTDETKDQTAYVVEVLKQVSLLNAPGYENTRLTYADGQVITLSPGDRVAGMCTVVTAYSEQWIEVRFVEDGVEYHGYVYSGYVSGNDISNVHTRLTTEVAVNIPTPTPLPTDTPTPTPTETPAPAVTVVPVPAQKQGNFPIIPFLIIVAVVVLLAAGGYYLYTTKRKTKSKEKSEAQITRLKNAMDRDSVVEQERKLYEKVDGGTKAAKSTGLGQGVYTVRGHDEDLTDNPADYEGDDELKRIAQNVKEKEIIKRELEALEVRDMVYHKYFGEGQVLDNSDVNNVEVKFNSCGVMYIDKEEAARKALMRKL